VNRLHAELHRVFGDPAVSPRAVMRVQVASGQGLAAGREEADRFVDAGADLVVLDSDVRSSAALAALGAVLDLDAVAVIGTTPYDGWHAQVVEVRDLLRTAKGNVFDAEALAVDPVLGRVVGLLHQLAVRRTPVLLGGGTTSAVGALLAARILPGAEQRWLAGSQPLDQAGRLALTALGLTPLLDLGLDRGSADLAVGLVRTGLEQLGA
jgi:nicotinate-nucleotide--dimethylbenzimidazole phosphoribosyltransferase